MSILAAALILASPADPTLYPVAFDDPVLQSEEVFVSEDARAEMVPDSEVQIRCLEMPEGQGPHALICLTTAEWQEVFDEIRHQESVTVRSREIGAMGRDLASAIP